MRLAILAATVLFTTAALAQTPAAVTSAPLSSPSAPATQATPATPATPAPKAGAKPKAPALTVKQRFEKANTSHDGKLPKAQATAAKWTAVSRDFVALDKDKKGYLTVDEVKAGLAKKPAAKKPAAAPATTKP